MFKRGMMDYKNESVWLMKGDCLERMKEIPSGSVDMVLTDPPYGTIKGLSSGSWAKVKTDWDVKLDTQAMLKECNRILRPNGALVLFAQDPYTSELITNPHGNLPFSYRYTWLKDHFANALIAKKAPVNYTEDVLVFFKKYESFYGHPLKNYMDEQLSISRITKRELIDLCGDTASHYFTDGVQFRIPIPSKLKLIQDATGCFKMTHSEMKAVDHDVKMKYRRIFNLPNGAKYKPNVLEYRKDYTGHHPTQKPVALLADLVETYTNEGETVLDFTMGSGSTGVACANTGRKFIGIELDDGYFDVAMSRILGG